MEIPEEIVELVNTEYTDLVMGERRADVVGRTRRGKYINIEIEFKKPDEMTYQKCLGYAIRIHLEKGMNVVTCLLTLQEAEGGIHHYRFAALGSTHNIYQKSLKSIDTERAIEEMIKKETLDKNDVIILEFGIFGSYKRKKHEMLKELTKLTNQVKLSQRQRNVVKYYQQQLCENLIDEQYQKEILEEIYMGYSLFTEIEKRAEKRGRKKGIEKGIEKGIKEGLEQGIEKGRKEGLEQGIKKIATKMKKQNIPLKQINQITGIPIKELKKIP